jgi:hypothetical protein
MPSHSSSLKASKGAGRDDSPPRVSKFTPINAPGPEKSVSSSKPAKPSKTSKGAGRDNSPPPVSKFTPINGPGPGKPGSSSKPARSESSSKPVSASSSKQTNAKDDLSHIPNLTPEEVTYLFGVAKKHQISEDKYKWADIAREINSKWSSDHTNARITKTWEFYHNAAVREHNKETGGSIRIEYSDEEDQELVSLIAHYGWLTWGQISKLLQQLTKHTKARDEDGVRNRFDRFLLPDLLSEQNAALLREMRVREELWKQFVPSFKRKVKKESDEASDKEKQDKKSDKEKRRKPSNRAVKTFSDALPKMNKEVLEGYEIARADSELRALKAKGWSDTEVLTLVKNVRKQAKSKKLNGEETVKLVSESASSELMLLAMDLASVSSELSDSSQSSQPSQPSKRGEKRRRSRSPNDERRREEKTVKEVRKSGDGSKTGKGKGKGKA